ncbi:MAG: hypothetical protein DMF60_09530 [Acidobacteria bacterium]|nr:MAG: hypothetical protein DMF60_09530 [Acidobacteriota bacterium]
MIELDPQRLFRRLAREIPGSLQRHLMIVGSLAAAYHYRSRLKRRAVNTKDADVIVHPAGDVGACMQIADTLLGLGWTRTDKCYPKARAKPHEDLRAIRLHPPESPDYFIELLGLPKRTQRERVAWVPVRLIDGWYGVGCHRFMAVTSKGRLRSKEGLDYASPAAMALTNALSHSDLGEKRMSEPVGGRAILRSAKDLGRVLALAWLEGREGTEAWLPEWRRMLKECFPSRWRTLARSAGKGLRSLLDSPTALEEARITTEVGLLNRLDVSTDMLHATGERLFADVISALADPNA